MVQFCIFIVTFLSFASLLHVVLFKCSHIGIACFNLFSIGVRLFIKDGLRLCNCCGLHERWSSWTDVLVVETTYCKLCPITPASILFTSA